MRVALSLTVVQYGALAIAAVGALFIRRNARANGAELNVSAPRPVRLSEASTEYSNQLLFDSVNSS